MIALDPAALETARKAVEDVLVQLRDDRLSVIGVGNGFVIREQNDQESSVMRLSTREGLAIGIKTYLAALESS